MTSEEFINDGLRERIPRKAQAADGSQAQEPIDRNDINIGNGINYDEKKPDQAMPMGRTPDGEGKLEHFIFYQLFDTHVLHFPSCHASIR